VIRRDVGGTLTGDSAVIWVSESTWKSRIAKPNEIALAPANPLPVMVTGVGSVLNADVGRKPVMVGGESAADAASAIDVGAIIVKPPNSVVTVSISAGIRTCTVIRESLFVNRHLTW
jgi:hypothetical protein